MKTKPCWYSFAADLLRGMSSIDQIIAGLGYILINGVLNCVSTWTIQHGQFYKKQPSGSQFLGDLQADYTACSLSRSGIIITEIPNFLALNIYH